MIGNLNALDLFDVAAARARNSDPSTSHKAARSVRNLSGTMLRILKVLEVHGPRTDDEIHTLGAFKDTPQSIRSRRAELVRMGKVADTGLTQKNERGRECAIWAAVK